MKKRERALSVVSVLAVGVTLAVGGALPASARATTLPAGEFLHGYSFDRNHSFDGVINVATGAATKSIPTASSSDIPAPEGAGYDTSTEKTWVISATTCDLWEIHADGSVSNRFHLATTTGTAALTGCNALMLNNDNTAYVAARIDEGAFRLAKIDLANGSLIGSLIETADIGGLSKDPTTGQVWATTVSGTTGLFKLDLSTGTLTDRQTIYDPVIDQNVDIWDMVFDSNGTLWMSAWGDDCILASIKPDAANPQATYNHVAYTRHNGTIWWTDAMWINGVSGPTGPSQPSLASTGSEGGAAIFWAAGAVLALLAGGGMLILRRRA